MMTTTQIETFLTFLTDTLKQSENDHEADSLHVEERYLKPAIKAMQEKIDADMFAAWIKP